ncbi:MAG: nucleotide exchange factor GrpE [Gammaproteobacteria bacterium]|nr:nucleotide exchange factor GrpE [Gammaproteobacteria bacterium]
MKPGRGEAAVTTEDQTSTDPESPAGARDDGADPAAATEPEALQRRIDELQQALDSARDQSLRTAAEMQNLRRRAERDVETAHKYALEKFVAALLPVVDNLERALAAIDSDNEVVRPLGEGVELTHKSLLDVLRQHGVQIVDPAAQGFDPALHQAVAMVPHPELPANQVVEVLQKGYTLNERLVRPAMVVVSQGVPDAGGQG